MLTALSIRDIVLIERLDVTLGRGLTVLTGETGAGKSVLLDALGLALGARGAGALVRAGAERGVVTAAFELARDHAVPALLEEHGIDGAGELVIRRIQTAQGPSRASINDQPVSINLLRQVGALLAEIHGQHDERALMEAAAHRRLLDAYGGLDGEARGVALAWTAWRAAADARAEHAERAARAAAERHFLEHAAAELDRLDPQPDEEEALAARRRLMMNAEQFASALDEAADALAGGGQFEPRLNAAVRKLERRAAEASGRLDAAISALQRLLTERAEAHAAVGEATRAFRFDPRELEAAEERLFALRAAARKYRCTVADLPAVAARMRQDLEAVAAGQDRLDRLSAEVEAARAGYLHSARALSARRQAAARALDAEVSAELAPLRLERARFASSIGGGEPDAGPHGLDRVEFQVAANPGTPLQPLARVASGGELARFMLALKVVLAARGSAPTLIFDEIDTGVGGAAADAVGARLARLARGLQVLAVTHSPQVAGRADQHLLISKIEEAGVEHPRMLTRLAALSAASRREEIARMLSGASVTEEARAQADRLLSKAG